MTNHAAAVNFDRVWRLLRIPLTLTDSAPLVQGTLKLWDADTDGVALTPGGNHDGDGADVADVVDPAAIAHCRLASALVDPVHPDLDDPAYIADQVLVIQADDAALAAQSERLITERVAYLARQVAQDPPPLPGAGAAAGAGSRFRMRPCLHRRLVLQS